MGHLRTGPVPSRVSSPAFAVVVGAVVLVALAAVLVGGMGTPFGSGSEAEGSGASIELVEPWNLVAASRSGTPQQVVG